LYKRSRWEESYELLKRVSEGLVRALMLHFAIHAISAMLGKPDLVAKLLTESSSQHGLTIVDLSIHDELIACELASRIYHSSARYMFSL
ncbi:MAG: hypothetical protein N3G77_07905, partial [Nitrososphaeria archaeon]|nr:hypothetical protein [Nitrososphaeria archaeon]